MNSIAGRPWERTTRAFWAALVVNAIWINASEIFRYFIFVMPMMRELLPRVPNVAPMTVGVFLVWGIWDTIIVVAATTFVWFCLEHFGRNWRVALLAGTALWIVIFVILWLALFNMSLASANVLAIALPLSWFELIVAAQIVNWSMWFFGLKNPVVEMQPVNK